MLVTWRGCWQVGLEAEGGGERRNITASGGEPMGWWDMEQRAEPEWPWHCQMLRQAAFLLLGGDTSEVWLRSPMKKMWLSTCCWNPPSELGHRCRNGFQQPRPFNLRSISGLGLDQREGWWLIQIQLWMDAVGMGEMPIAPPHTPLSLLDFFIHC